jgi:hypothetical protein
MELPPVVILPQAVLPSVVYAPPSSSSSSDEEDAVERGVAKIGV